MNAAARGGNWKGKGGRADRVHAAAAASRSRRLAEATAEAALAAAASLPETRTPLTSTAPDAGIGALEAAIRRRARERIEADELQRRTGNVSATAVPFMSDGGFGVRARRPGGDNAALGRTAAAPGGRGGGASPRAARAGLRTTGVQRTFTPFTAAVPMAARADGHAAQHQHGLPQELRAASAGGRTGQPSHTALGARTADSTALAAYSRGRAAIATAAPPPASPPLNSPRRQLRGLSAPSGAGDSNDGVGTPRSGPIGAGTPRRGQTYDFSDRDSSVADDGNDTGSDADEIRAAAPPSPLKSSETLPAVRVRAAPSTEAETPSPRDTDTGPWGGEDDSRTEARAPPISTRFQSTGGADFTAYRVPPSFATDGPLATSLPLLPGGGGDASDVIEEADEEDETDDEGPYHDNMPIPQGRVAVIKAASEEAARSESTTAVDSRSSSRASKPARLEPVADVPEAAAPRRSLRQTGDALGGRTTSSGSLRNNESQDGSPRDEAGLAKKRSLGAELLHEALSNNKSSSSLRRPSAGAELLNSMLTDGNSNTAGASGPVDDTASDSSGGVGTVEAPLLKKIASMHPGARSDGSPRATNRALRPTSGPRPPSTGERPASRPGSRRGGAAARSAPAEGALAPAPPKQLRRGRARTPRTRKRKAKRSVPVTTVTRDTVQPLSFRLAVGEDSDGSEESVDAGSTSSSGTESTGSTDSLGDGHRARPTPKRKGSGHKSRGVVYDPSAPTADKIRHILPQAPPRRPGARARRGPKERPTGRVVRHAPGFDSQNGTRRLSGAAGVNGPAQASGGTDAHGESVSLSSATTSVEDAPSRVRPNPEHLPQETPPKRATAPGGPTSDSSDADEHHEDVEVLEHAHHIDRHVTPEPTSPPDEHSGSGEDPEERDHVTELPTVDTQSGGFGFDGLPSPRGSAHSSSDSSSRTSGGGDTARVMPAQLGATDGSRPALRTTPSARLLIRQRSSSRSLETGSHSSNSRSETRKLLPHTFTGRRDIVLVRAQTFNGISNLLRGKGAGARVGGEAAADGSPDSAGKKRSVPFERSRSMNKPQLTRAQHVAQSQMERYAELRGTRSFDFGRNSARAHLAMAGAGAYGAEDASDPGRTVGGGVVLSPDDEALEESRRRAAAAALQKTRSADPSSFRGLTDERETLSRSPSPAVQHPYLDPRETALGMGHQTARPHAGMTLGEAGRSASWRAQSQAMQRRARELTAQRAGLKSAGSANTTAVQSHLVPSRRPPSMLPAGLSHTGPGAYGGAAGGGRVADALLRTRKWRSEGRIAHDSAARTGAGVRRRGQRRSADGPGTSGRLKSDESVLSGRAGMQDRHEFIDTERASRRRLSSITELQEDAKRRASASTVKSGSVRRDDASVRSSAASHVPGSASVASNRPLPKHPNAPSNASAAAPGPWQLGRLGSSRAVAVSSSPRITPEPEVVPSRASGVGGFAGAGSSGALLLSAQRRTSFRTGPSATPGSASKLPTAVSGHHLYNRRFR